MITINTTGHLKNSLSYTNAIKKSREAIGLIITRVKDAKLRSLGLCEGCRLIKIHQMNVENMHLPRIEILLRRGSTSSRKILVFSLVFIISLQNKS